MTHFHELFEYHQNTKHSYFSVRSNPNRIDWNNPPNRFKTYSLDYKRINLNKENQNSKFLYLIAGISAKKTYPNMEYYLRVNPSAGALYPNEIYFQVRNEDGFEDGIYHYEVSSSSITLLKEFSLDEGIEANLGLDYSYDGFMFFISSLYFRSSWKYINRAFRYCLLDAGHIIGSIEFSSYLFNKEFEIIYDFNKEEINKIFNFDNKEFFTSIVISGNKNENKKQPLTLDIQTIDGTGYEEENISFFEINKIIEQAYKDSIKITQKTMQKDKSNYVFNKDLLQDTIFKRRSIREFSNQSISKVQFESIMNILNQ
ncbi:MAG: SagB family peptide dehydrogenase, partial [Poseidonibacter sp.]|uniref:SagB/ThcOx family dehydrogenase n=1 Tax=Poseidonibacter sp. TaxID=2321188 RepID=UPI00359D840D